MNLSGGGPGSGRHKEIQKTVSEWREHLWNRGAISKLAHRTVKGGDLAHFHPGKITVYRGEGAGSNKPSKIGTSWSKSKTQALKHGSRLRTMDIDENTPALDVNKVLKGIPSKSSGEKEVFIPAQKKKMSGAQTKNIRAGGPGSGRHKGLDALDTLPVIDRRDTDGVKTPLKVVPYDKTAAKFDNEEAIRKAPDKEFNTKDLVTEQDWISKKKVSSLITNRRADSQPAVVMKTKQGLLIYRGNHRAAAAHLAGDKFKAKYIDALDIKAGAQMIPGTVIQAIYPAVHAAGLSKIINELKNNIETMLAGGPGSGWTRENGHISRHSTAPVVPSNLVQPPLNHLALERRIKAISDSLAAKYGFPKWNFEADPKIRAFTLGGRTYYSAANYTPSTGKISVSGPMFRDAIQKGETDVLEGTLAHEMHHHIYHKVMDQYGADARVALGPKGAYMTDGRIGGGAKQESDGTITFEHPDDAKRFPLVAKLNPYMTKDGTELLRMDDGVTKYSQAYWDEARFSSPSDWRVDLAKNETIAEIGKLKHKGEDDKVSTLWQEFYEKVVGSYHVDTKTVKAAAAVQKTKLKGKVVFVGTLDNGMKVINFKDGSQIIAIPKNKFKIAKLLAGGPGSGRHKGFTEYTEIKEGIPAGKSNECQSNSARTNRKQGLTTVIGVLKERKPSGTFKNNHIPHAWNIDSDGKVVDTTLGSAGAKDYKYIGRPVPHTIGKNALKIDEEFYAKDIKKTFFSAYQPTNKTLLTPGYKNPGSMSVPKKQSKLLKKNPVLKEDVAAGGPGSGRHKEKFTNVYHGLRNKGDAEDILKNGMQVQKVNSNFKTISVAQEVSKSVAMRYGAMNRSKDPDKEYAVVKMRVPLATYKSWKKDPELGATKYTTEDIPAKYVHSVQYYKVPEGVGGGYDTSKHVLVREVKPSEISSGGPGSGRHKELDTLQKHKSEDVLEEQRKKYAEKTAKLADEGKSARGKPILSEKAQRAKANVVTATKEHHDKAEEVERMIAKKIGGQQSADNKPFDVTKTDSKGKNHAIEVKALLMQKNDKITMKNDAMQRKNKWAKQNKHKIHTVAVDLRGPKPIYYHRHGVGSFRVGNMDQVKGGLAGLSKLFA